MLPRSRLLCYISFTFQPRDIFFLFLGRATAARGRLLASCKHTQWSVQQPPSSCFLPSLLLHRHYCQPFCSTPRQRLGQMLLLLCCAATYPSKPAVRSFSLVYVVSSQQSLPTAARLSVVRGWWGGRCGVLYFNSSRVSRGRRNMKRGISSSGTCDGDLSPRGCGFVDFVEVSSAALLSLQCSLPKVAQHQ